jgi:hypothetical protein
VFGKEGFCLGSAARGGPGSFCLEGVGGAGTWCSPGFRWLELVGSQCKVGDRWEATLYQARERGDGAQIPSFGGSL